MTRNPLYRDAPIYCHPYFDLIPTDQLMDALEYSARETNRVFGFIEPENENYAYTLNKWTTKEVIRHIIDCERVYAYRALRFSRFDVSSLCGFDENEYVNNFNGTNYGLNDLKNEYKCVRESSILLFKNMTDKMLDFKGVANQVEFTPKTLGFMIAGHNLHHINILETIYLGKNEFKQND
ncbi:DinB family protein [Muricauda sp. 334s03]|uniref:DinB family protein n=1 Tax=Flagellimonas yonaguniensis TaxID=3031325 RepID=A0ABT5Y135_9FLAO|nr:DinB family protein [[Muricauda] yonaguniensis]MDF0717150.1 DinB family protein [[Muricauda] yonaguniensis]